MAEEAWKTGYVRCLGVQLFGGDIDVDEHGESISGDTMLLLFNADHGNTIRFVLPPPGQNASPWELVFDTAEEASQRGTPVAGKAYPLEPCSMVVLQARLAPAEDSLFKG